MIDAFIFTGAIFLVFCWLARRLLGATGRREFARARGAYVSALVSTFGIIFFLGSLLIPGLWAATYPAPLVAFAVAGASSWWAITRTSD